VTIREFLFGLRDRIVHRSQVGKEKLDATFARRELDRRFLTLGERYYELVREGGAPPAEELREVIREVDGLVQRLAAHREHLRRLEEEAATQS